MGLFDKLKGKVKAVADTARAEHARNEAKRKSEQSIYREAYDSAKLQAIKEKARKDARVAVGVAKLPKLSATKTIAKKRAVNQAYNPFGRF